ncbi:hypothetical protein GZH46_00219, partial [Fragariocoptes setiger]
NNQDKMPDEEQNQQNATSNNASDPEDDDKNAYDEAVVKEAARKRCYKYQDEPKLYRDVNGPAALKDLQQLVTACVSEQEIVYLHELDDYLTDRSGSWTVGDEHLTMLSNFLANDGNRFAPNVPLLTLQLLQAASLKDDFVLILHQDRKEHRLMTYINAMEHLTLAEQEEIVKLLCNFCGVPGSFDWLMYISEWTDHDGSVTSNSRVTTKAAVHALLNDKLVTLQDCGVNLMFNLALKNVFDDVASELSTAILQYLHGDNISDEHMYICLLALTRFIEINTSEVLALVKMLGPDLNKLLGRSKQCDEMVVKIQAKCQ